MSNNRDRNLDSAIDRGEDNRYISTNESLKLNDGTANDIDDVGENGSDNIDGGVSLGQEFYQLIVSILIAIKLRIKY